MKVAVPRSGPTSVAMVRFLLIALTGALLIALLASFGTAVRLWLLPSDARSLADVAQLQRAAETTWLMLDFI